MLMSSQMPPAGHDASLRCEVVTDLGTITALRESWDATALALGAPACMSFDWMHAWWDHYGAGRDLRVLLFWRGSQLASMVPLYLERFGAGPWKTIVARLVGANLPPRCFDPPIDGALAGDIVGHMHRQVFIEDGGDLLSFGPLSERWFAFAPVHDAIAAAGTAAGAATFHQGGVQMLLALSPEFSEKLRTSKTAKRSLREMEKIAGVSTDVVSAHPDLQPAFEAFAAQHAAQWRALGRGGHFAAWPKGHEFHRTLVERQGRLGRVRIFRVRASGTLVAATYNYVFGKTLFAELTSRAVEGEWGKLGLGNAINATMFQNAISAGLSTVDLGAGDYAHKAILGAEAVPVGTWRIVGPRRANRVRSALFLKAAKMVDIVYHKLWYRRVVPRLPSWAGRSQSRFWLRFQV
jgi:CelD/BcsL family acetyltransferase involved in cellulose biosynthesis